MDPRLVRVEAEYYEQFDADWSLEAPAEGYGGWKTGEVELSLGHTAVVVMHAWECGTQEQYPGWHRVVEYFPRAERIVREVFPRLLGAVRGSGMQVFHVVGPGDYFQKLPGYRRAVELAGPGPAPLEMIELDGATAKLQDFRRRHCVSGVHNMADIERGYAVLDFPEGARPVGEEGIAENGHQLAALCRHHGICHLVYVGFAINWCLLLSPGGMAEMRRYGVVCSTIREAVTAVENKETARAELCKQLGLWRVTQQFGLVFGLADFVGALERGKR